MNAPFSSLDRLLAVGLAALAVSLAWLASLHRTPAVPWSFLPFLGLAVVPETLVLHAIAYGAGTSRRFTPRVIAGLGIVAGLMMLVFARSYVMWGGAAIGACVMPSVRNVLRKSALWKALAMLAIAYGTIWNLNYALGLLTQHRLVDEWLVRFDLGVFSRLGLSGASYNGVFPLVHSPVLFTALENAYLLLFTQIVVVTLWMAADSEDSTRRWLLVLFSAYGTGLLVFAIIPAVGPHIYKPDSFHPDFQSSLTFQLMGAMAQEYIRLLAGDRLTGFGYFVAVPSLHVAGSMLCLLAVRQSRFLFWTFLPVTILLISSTVLLGYHYLLDVPAGLLLASVLTRFLPRVDLKMSAPRHAML